MKLKPGYYVMPSVLFSIAIDWVLCRTVEDQRRGIRWTPFSTLEDLDFVDDVALLSYTRQHIQEKTDQLSMIDYFEEQQCITRQFNGNQANQKSKISIFSELFLPMF